MMKTKMKSALILIGVLFIGIVIGAAGNSLIRKSMWEDRVNRFRSPRGFSDRLIDLIQPDPQQEAAVKSILLKHHEKMQSLAQESRTMLRTHVDSLLIELESVLRPEQVERAKRLLRRRPGPPHIYHRREPPSFEAERERQEKRK
jgi:hypothetical protein